MREQIWEVVGGVDKGGIIVRKGKDTASTAETERLSTGALVLELELEGERLRYQRLQGKGPNEGWVSLKLKTKDLLVKTDKGTELLESPKPKPALEQTSAAPGVPPGPTFEQLEEWVIARYQENVAQYQENVAQQSTAEATSSNQQTDPSTSENVTSGENDVRKAATQKEETSGADNVEDNTEEAATQERAASGTDDVGDGAKEAAKQELLAKATAPPTGWLSRLGMERIANFRDGAGFDAGTSFKCTGGQIRRGLLYRTGQWNSATNSDLERLTKEFDVKTYIDLRTGEDNEGGAAPCYDLYPPCPSGRHKDLPGREPGERRRVHCPFTKGLKLRTLTADEKASTIPSNDRRALANWWYQAVILRNEKHMQAPHPIVVLCCMVRAVLFANDDEVLRAMKLFTDPANYPIAYGCMAGKDRTGLLGCLVLTALGVSPEDIYADYLATNDSAAHISACIQICQTMWTEELKTKNPKKYKNMHKWGQIPDPEHQPNVDPNSSTPLHLEKNIASDEANLTFARVYREIMQYTVFLLETECGGVVKYLESIGFGEEDLSSMRRILVEDN